MKWADVKRTLTTPPAPQAPPAKQPLFTTDVFSTTSFGPGHLVGAVVLAGSLFGLARYFVRRGQVRARCWAQQQEIASAPLAKRDDRRGHYGRTP